MNISHIEHIGVAVKSIEESLPYYENVLGFKCYAVEEVKDQMVKTAFLKVGETKIELLEPTSEESPIAKFLENRGPGIHLLLSPSGMVWPMLWQSVKAKRFASLTSSLAKEPKASI